MKHLGTRILETRRLILRPFEMKDAPAMYENWARDPEVAKYVTWPAHSSVEVTRMLLADWTQRYEKPDRYCWAIVPRDGDGRPIGNISGLVRSEELRWVEIGYCLSRAWWGGGVMTEALEAVIGFFFAQVEANRIDARFDTENPASGRVMEKAGMTFEGILRQAATNNRGVIDIGVSSILAEEWKRKIAAREL